MADRSMAGKTIAFLVAPEGTEQVELTAPWEAVQQAGGTPVLLSTAPGKIQAFHHLDKADSFTVDRLVTEVTVEEFDGLVLPGGVANPDQLRTDQGAVAFVRRFVESGKPVAAICHAIWALVEADVVRGRELTSWPSLRTDVRNAGGTWHDREVVVSDNIVTSRMPDDIAAFTRQFAQMVAAGGARAA